ncbi:MAG: SsrA-binding protein [Kosmotogales bacterium]|nr:SsrA-binding protein [Kosmotogales bacterium]
MKTVVTNRKARFQYFLLEKWEAGVSLKGTEVKSLREGAASLNESYCKIEGNEVFLLESNITPYNQGNIWNHDPKRKRKLLMHKKEILKIKQKLMEKGLTLIPVKIYFNDKGKAKVEVALAKGKKLYDKRETIQKRDTERRLRGKEY